MKIITDINECNKLIKNHKNSILDSYGYKKILNLHYNPDAYLFFVDGEDVIPLVVKNNLVTFFGGARHNHAHTLPRNKVLLNSMLTYLKKENYRFQLTSINQDYFDLLENSNKYFDVPYPAEWHYKQIQHYDQISIIEASHGKKRQQLRQILKKSQDYTFITLPFSEFKRQYHFIMQAHFNYFSDRGQESIWKDNEDFFLDLWTYFNREENLLIRLIKFKQDIVGISISIYNNKEMIFFFISSLTKNNPFIIKIMYFDMLAMAKSLAVESKITQFNAMRGAMSNKGKFGMTPVPLYALIKDDNWVVQVDSDIDPESYASVYGRNNWGRTE